MPYGEANPGAPKTGADCAAAMGLPNGVAEPNGLAVEAKAA